MSAAERIETPPPVRLNTVAGANAVMTITDQLFEENSKWWVHFRRSGESRSQKQRRLMARWAEEWVLWLQHHKGDAYSSVTPDDAYNSFKWRCVLPRLIAEDTTGIWQMCEARIIALNSEREKLNFAGSWIHSDSLSTEEYFHSMEDWAKWTLSEEQSDGQFRPTNPDDKKYIAMWHR